ncbi:MAG: pyruvate kinase, partial [Acidimicrobiia bacterium]
MRRRTKIVASIGPASDSPAVLKAMIEAGMNVARLSLAHGPLEETLERMARVRAAAAEARRFIGVLADLPGPKIRASSFPGDGVHLTEGERIDVVVAGPGVESDHHRLAVDLPQLLEDLLPGDRVVLGDGGITLLVEQVHAERAVAEVLSGGWVQGRPGVSLPAGRFNQAAPTAEDLRLIEGLCDAEVDAIAVSFVCSGADVARAKDAVGGRGPMVIAKIETQEAVDNRDEIIAEADGVMVARGDLGIRCAIEDVPHYQKRIIRAGVAFGRPVITATQMLESMVRAPTPTRAEVSDIANAVFDGTSALMLSGETAIGHAPASAVR